MLPRESDSEYYSEIITSSSGVGCLNIGYLTIASSGGLVERERESILFFGNKHVVIASCRLQGAFD